ncbi:MAG: glutaredoxin family protein [Pirellulales bacterium]|nr:glutaredoxin family protein [Pirellulales bacterium]
MKRLPSDPMPTAILYTRQGCCLCEQAKSVLFSHGLSIDEIDVDSDPALREKYDHWVPVVAIDGKERFRGRIDEVLLRRLLRN